MRSRPLYRRVALLAVCAGTAGAVAQVHPHARMLRNPDVSATHIVFVYANDLWIVPRTGGTATPLASPRGIEAFPRFSADGRIIAFMGNYEGNVDLYTIALEGGVPTRVTYHPHTEVLCDWTPDQKLLFFSSGLAPLPRQTLLMTVPPAGGLPQPLPVPYGANGAISADGQWLAYTPHTTDNRTWKRYQGGMATDIWLFNLHDRTSRRATDWPGTDSQPMWHGEQLYYLSDEGAEHRLNIWVYDLRSGQRAQITRFSADDVKWPAIGPGPAGQGEIVFQNGADLCLLDLPSRQTRVVEVIIPGDRPTLLPQRVRASDYIQSLDVSPRGKRAVMQARGDVWTVPARRGSPRNLTRTSGVAERDAAWSPDGKSIAYFSDETGEYELYIAPADSKGPATRHSEHGPGFLYNPVWAPDSQKLVYADQTGTLYLRLLEGAETRTIVTDPWARIPQVSWSHDSDWLAYTRTGTLEGSSLWVYQVSTGQSHQLTAGMFNDSGPTFDRKGDYLFFTTNRRLDHPIYADLDGTWVYVGTDMLCLVPLRADVASPWLPKSDEETEAEEKAPRKGREKKPDDQPEDEKKKDEDAPGEGAKDGAPDSPADPDPQEPAGTQPAEASQPTTTQAAEEETEEATPKKKPKALKIDLEGFERRVIPLPLKPGDFGNLAVNDQGHLLYVRGASRGSEGEPAIKIFDVQDEDKKEKNVLAGVGGFVLSADGKKLLVRKGSTLAIVDARPEQKLDKPMSLDGLVMQVDPRAEWRQMFVESWRILRDFFYVANMHGVDWPRVRDHYAAMLPDCVARDDLSYIIKEMISELNVGHAYYRAGDVDQGPSVSVGMLGADLELHNGAYRIKQIYTGGPWDLDARGPLSQPGVKVSAGDYLLAVNGVALDPQKDPWAAFQGLAGRTVVLTVSGTGPGGPTATGPAEAPQPATAPGATQPTTLPADAREVVIELLSSEIDLRYRAWIEKNRAYVDQRSGGRIGYIHVPDTGREGQAELYRQFYGQRLRPALIIDERWNGGGQVPDRFIELLNRPLYNYWARRHGHEGRTPGYSHQGPKCMLINGLAGSGGDAFPSYFKQAGLGKLIGTRTWGGLVGISGNPALIDNVFVSAPTFGYYKLDGTWGIEGVGVAPDIEVIDDPAKMQDGADPQLDAAIAHLLAELEQHPYQPPPRPPDPDRSGMGVGAVR